MTKTHVMLDLETWGTKPGCDIRSIGAVVFDPISGVSHDGEHQFYIACDNPMRPIQVLPWDERKYALHRSVDTVEWWSKQSEAAQAAFANPVDMRRALLNFTEWLGNVSGHPTTALVNGAFPDTICIWAHGPQFDVSILAAVYDALNMPVPWNYRAPRDVRTIVDAADMTSEEMKQFNHGTEHHALDDAIAQAMVVCEAFRRIREGK